MKNFFLILLMVLLIPACSMASSDTEHELVAPTMAELCHALGRDQFFDPLCSSRHKVLILLEEEFPSGTATKAEVEEVLQPYLEESIPLENGATLNVYIVGKAGLLGWPVRAIFRFKNDGVLNWISIED